MATPVFPTTINPPDQQGYQYTPGKDFIETKLDGGSSRVRRDVLGMTHMVKCCWSCTPTQYTQIMGFFRERVQGRSKLFRINLLIDIPALVPYVARLIDTPNTLTYNEGLIYKVEATLEVTPNPIKSFSLFCQRVSDNRIVDAGTVDYTGEMNEFPLARTVMLYNCIGVVDGVPINLDGTGYLISTKPTTSSIDLGATAPTINPGWTALAATTTKAFFPAAGACILLPL